MYMHVYNHALCHRKDSKVSVERVNFRQFVRTLARFRRSAKGHEHVMNSRDKKIECEVSSSRHLSLPPPLTPPCSCVPGL